MGGLKIGTDDYKYIWNCFIDPDNRAYDLENYDKEAIWRDPNMNFHKKKEYDMRQFKQSVGRLIEKIKSLKEAGVCLYVSCRCLECLPCL